MPLECGDCSQVKDDLLPPERVSRWKDVMERDKKLLIAIIVLLVLMNIPYGRYVLYPFLLFSTWVHEMCHGFAALLVGGSIAKIQVFQDGSGLAYTSMNGALYDLRRVIVASAGYTGTAIVGGVLLIFRRTRRGPRRVIFGTSLLILLTIAFWIRNTFGIVAMSLIAVALGLCGWFLDAEKVGYLYAFLASTCCLNAVESIHSMFVSRDCVWGENRANDAETVADYTGIPYWFWGGLWLVFAFVMLVIGLLFAVEPSEGPSSPAYAEKNRDTAPTSVRIY